VGTCVNELGKSETVWQRLTPLPAFMSADLNAHRLSLDKLPGIEKAASNLSD
jgi:hypothetical protein